jgi:hypothetical protein
MDTKYWLLEARPKELNSPNASRAGRPHTLPSVQVRCRSVWGQFAGWFAARWRPVEASAPASGSTDGAYFIRTLRHKPPKRYELPPPTTHTAVSTTITDFPFIVSTTSPFCVYRLACALSTRFKAADSYTHVALFMIICVFNGKKAYTIITIRTPQVSLRRACQGNVGLSTALPKPATEALCQHTGSVRWWQSS